MRTINKWLLIMVMVVILCPGLALAGQEADSVVMRLDETVYYIDGQIREMQAAPFTHEGVTMVPLRVISEVFGVNVSWEQSTGIVNLQLNDDDYIQIDTLNNKAYTGAATGAVDVITLVQDGVTLVPLRFLAENMNYLVNYNTNTREITIEKLPPPNRQPVAAFELAKDTYAQGETVTYIDTSYDPDGDEIVERNWQGKQDAFFKPGEYEVSLTVRDSRGAWSEPCTRVIKVTEEVLMDQLTYYFTNPVLGQPLDISEIPVLDLKILSKVVTQKKESIIISNNPETFKKEGILYRDEVKGDNRILYHHANGTDQPKSVFLLAINNGEEPVTVQVKRWGTAGPSDPMGVGRLAAYYFLGFDKNEAYSFELQPGEKIILNQNANSPLKPGQTVHGIFDVHADNYVTFAVVAVGKQDPVNDYEKLSMLSREPVHTRGTFQLPSRNMTVKMQYDQPSRIVIADGTNDTFLYGKDETTGQSVIYTRNVGNYGVVYSITLETKHRIGVILNPRGGAFAGAGSWDGESFFIPNSGILRTNTEGALLGILEPGQRKVLEFIPPAGSYLPVNILCIPF